LSPPKERKIGKTNGKRGTREKFEKEGSCNIISNVEEGNKRVQHRGGIIRRKEDYLRETSVLRCLMNKRHQLNASSGKWKGGRNPSSHRGRGGNWKKKWGRSRVSEKVHG